MLLANDLTLRLPMESRVLPLCPPVRPLNPSVRCEEVMLRRLVRRLVLNVVYVELRLPALRDLC